MTVSWQRGSGNRCVRSSRIPNPSTSCASGKTVAGNLVAGHFAVNTLMMVIENKVSHASHSLGVRVTVKYVGGKPAIADVINYEVYRKTSMGWAPRWSYVIDGGISSFSESVAMTLESNINLAR